MTTKSNDAPRTRAKFKGDAGYLTAKLREDQIRFINRVAGPRPGGRAASLRELLDMGIKVARARIARC